MKRNIHLERTYPHPIDSVWAALTDSRAIATWLMDNDFEPRLGHRFNFRMKPQPGFDGIVYCEVVEFEAPRRLAYSWRGGPGGGKPILLDTVVSFTLLEEGEGTRLLLDHRGFDGFKAVLVSFMMGSGWAKMMRGKLRSSIETMARGDAPSGVTGHGDCAPVASKTGSSGATFAERI